MEVLFSIGKMFAPKRIKSIAVIIEGAGAAPLLQAKNITPNNKSPIRFTIFIITLLSLMIDVGSNSKFTMQTPFVTITIAVFLILPTLQANGFR